MSVNYLDTSKPLMVIVSDDARPENHIVYVTANNAAHACLKALAESMSVWGHTDETIQLLAQIVDKERGEIHHYTVSYRRDETMSTKETEEYLRGNGG